MAPKPTGPSAHDTSTSPSYPMGPFSTGDSSYTNTVPEDLDEHNPHPDHPRDLNPNTEAPPMYAPPQRHLYGSQQHLVQDAPAHPPPAYSKYTTAAQARWAKSSRIAKMLCIGFFIAIIVIIVAVSAGVSLTRQNGNGVGGGGGDFGGGDGGFNCGNNADSGNSCTTGSDCSSGRCGGPNGFNSGQCC